MSHSPYQEETAEPKAVTNPRIPVRTKIVLQISSIAALIMIGFATIFWMQTIPQQTHIALPDTGIYIDEAARDLCENSGGTFSGCPPCPDPARCGVCLGCSCPAGLQLNSGECTAIQIEPGHSSCVTDNECAVVSTQCDACECGAAVNSRYQDAYIEINRLLCQEYSGPVCRFACVTPYPRCIDGQCVLSAVPIDTNTKTILTIERTGGLCVYGACSDTLEVFSDGRYVISGGGEIAERFPEGSIPENLLTGLSSEIDRADFQNIVSKSFTGVCPIAYDGQELTVTFNQADIAIPSCTYVVDFNLPVFYAVQQIMLFTDF